MHAYKHTYIHTDKVYGQENHVCLPPPTFLAAQSSAFDGNLSGDKEPTYIHAYIMTHLLRYCMCGIYVYLYLSAYIGLHVYVLNVNMFIYVCVCMYVLR